MPQRANQLLCPPYDSKLIPRCANQDISRLSKDILSCEVECDRPLLNPLN